MYISYFAPLLLSAILAAKQASCVSTHNWWQIPNDFGDVNEIISSIRVPVGSDPSYTYWCANGFTGGYMGMQHNGGDERRILFSIWDNGNGSVVDLVQKGSDDTVAEGFGGEGTGAHAFLRYNWSAGQTVFFKVATAIDTEKNGTAFSGYYSLNDGESWNLVATFFANEQLKYLTYPYGFLENYAGTPGLREGFYGNWSATNTEGETVQIKEMWYFDHTTPSGSLDEVWMYKDSVGPNSEVYQRIDGAKDQGIYPPTNPN